MGVFPEEDTNEVGSKRDSERGVVVVDVRSCSTYTPEPWNPKANQLINGWMFGDFQPFVYVMIWFIIQLKHIF